MVGFCFVRGDIILDMFSIISVVHAQAPGTAEASRFVERVNEVILFPIITLLIAVALLVFVYGSVMFIMNANAPAAREQGRKHIMWGIIGMLVMLSAYAILSIASNTFGLGGDLDCADNPAGPGCDSVFSTERLNN